MLGLQRRGVDLYLSASRTKHQGEPLQRKDSENQGPARLHYGIQEVLMWELGPVMIHGGVTAHSRALSIRTAMERISNV